MQRLKNNNKVRAGAVLVGLAGVLASAPVFALPADKLSVEDIAFTDEGRSLSIDADVLGLDEDRDTVVTLVASAEVELACINPRGNEVWWRQPDDMTIELSGSDTFSDNLIDSGRLEIILRSDQIGDEIPGAPDCPACPYGVAQWTEEVKAVRFSEATVIVRQAGKDLLTLQCSFDSPSANGEIPASEVNCEIP